MAQLIQRVASWLAQEVAVPLIAKTRPFQAAARASVQGVEKVKGVSKSAGEAAAEAARKSKEAAAAVRAEAAANIPGTEASGGQGMFQSMKEFVKKVCKRSQQVVCDAILCVCC